MLLPLCLLVALTSTPAFSADDFESEWNRFMIQFEKHYADNDELIYRKGVFKRNYDEIQEHNAKYAQGLHSYEKGINQFTDRTIDELQESLLMELPSDWETTADTFTDRENSLTDQLVVDQIDYRTLGAVTPVKNQGCGDCWAFSAVAAIESHYALVSGNLTSLSEQELDDCSKHNRGCKGGLPSLAFADLKKLGGITTRHNYPYHGKNDKCKLTRKMPKVKVLGYKFVAGNEKALKKAVALKGPISVLIEATRHFSYYRRGIFHDSSCDSKCNHAVLVVGYGTDNKTGHDYWIIKNSWGNWWGEHGYARIIRNSHKNCHIASYAVYPIVKAGLSSL